MNTGTRNYSKAKRIAQRLANQTGLPYVVFTPYMPSVYPVNRTPLFVEKPPTWWLDKVEDWVQAKVSQGYTVVRPRAEKQKQQTQGK